MKQLLNNVPFLSKPANPWLPSLTKENYPCTESPHSQTRITKIALHLIALRAQKLSNPRLPQSSLPLLSSFPVETITLGHCVFFLLSVSWPPWHFLNWFYMVLICPLRNCKWQTDPSRAVVSISFASLLPNQMQFRHMSMCINSLISDVCSI